FDEPVNGLDPEGVTWIRHLMRDLAAAERTVFVSSHLLSEMTETADHLVVIARGRLIADAPLAELLDTTRTARERTPTPAALAEVLDRADLTVSFAAGEGSALHVSGEDIGAIGALAHAAGLQIDELSFSTATLENVYTSLTEEATEYRAGGSESMTMP